ITDDVGHALGHVFFERVVRWRPFWLAEGAAELFRKVGRNADTRRVADGYPVSDILEIVPARQYDDDAPASPFRIQAHRLLRIVMAQYPSELRSFLKDLATDAGEGAKPDIDLKQLQSKFDAYVETALAASPAPTAAQIRTVPSASEAIAIHRGDLLLAAKKTSEAAAWYRGGTAEARLARPV